MTQQPQPERIPLGRTDISIPPMGTGAWAWGDRLFWGYGSGYGEDDVEAAFQASLEAGINFFDTAEVYGFGGSERLLGRFIRAAGQPAIVATKFMPLPWRLGRGSVLRALRKSLARLGMERVDLYQIHFPRAWASIEALMDTLADATEAGLTQAVGVSNYNLEQMQRAHEALARRGVPLASNQVEYSLLHRQPERTGLLAACHELDVTLIAYCPLAQGLLTGKYTPDNPPRGWMRRFMRRAKLAQVQPLVSRLREVGEAHGGKAPGQVALNWVMRKGAVPIPGAKNARQAGQNAGALGWRLSDGEIAAVDAASDAVQRS